jgi:hypothetical protein
MRNRNPIFPTEQTPAAPVEGMILIDAEQYRHERRQIEELRMRVSELSGKVDVLISLATNYKSAADSQQAASLPPDDPEIEALASRIDDAIAVLQGAKSVGEVIPATDPAPAPVAADPNAPV